ncbi:MAG: hypothetical protein IJX55_02060 [Clostridia bacterium]|nr:hypothetical protein [Clostridia bacterium]
MKGTYKIAEKNIEIISLYGGVHKLCAEYASEGTPDFSVEILQSDIDFERERSAAEDTAAGREAAAYSESYLETLAVYRKIADKMVFFDTLLFHGSAIAVDGEAYLFTAKSGTGKSTHTRLWRELFGERAVMINDDKPLIRITEAGAVVYGTPWNGKHRLGTNACAPLRAICILERDTVNHIEKTDRKSAYPLILQQTHRPARSGAMIMTLGLTDKLSDKIPIYRLGCNMEPEAARVAYEGMNK